MIRETLQRHGISPDTNQDQHFLASDAILEREVEEAELDGDETVLEIGAGIGNLTTKLADAAGHVIAVERDRRLIPVLKEELAHQDNVEIVEGDILDVDIPAFDACVSNPPYHISSELIELLGRRERRSVLTLQQAFAERLVAEPGSGDYSRITVLTNYYFVPVYLQEVPAEEFYPRPEVDSALLRFFPRNDRFGIRDRESFFTVVRGLFTHKRKKVRNAFVDARHILDMTKKEARRRRDDIPYSEERVINLDMKQLAEIADHLSGRR
ncbi:MAG: 16S rRNA (adenine(1518)-N(6)/adenine(1519)-N(6))-dimethyltransferase RsmA [Candidatus Nanohaloarchaea archaeon]|nr:16S rRNA (adenine(1518)-N(6)/adenine(1519)-N(6))-dimethyltransferase RsmA [Candidatus Nanohaloarchaea archaeon]